MEYGILKNNSYNKNFILLKTTIFVFIFSWNELLIALFFTVSESRTFPIFISAQVSQAQIIWGNVAAATVIQSIPPILLTIFLQKNIVSGLTLGAVKN